jgi:hypothetical protein
VHQEVLRTIGKVMNNNRNHWERQDKAKDIGCYRVLGGHAKGIGINNEIYNGESKVDDGGIKFMVVDAKKDDTRQQGSIFIRFLTNLL